MQVDLKYGRHGLSVNVPDDATVLEPTLTNGLPDETQALRDALCNPVGCPALRDIVHTDDSVVVVFSDVTRPMPNDRVMPILLEELESAGVPRDQISLLNGLGTHRPNTPQELEEMLGARILSQYRIEQHDAFDPAQNVDLGRLSNGHPALVNRIYYEADSRIVTGFIEPHIFAGFSGGPKAILPGVAGIETIMDNHGYAMLRDPNATWGYTVGNPVWEEMREFARLVPAHFVLNVTLNRQRQITQVFAGDLELAHARGVEQVRRTSMVGVEKPFDVVLVTNGGYPLDINLYQSVKGMSCAAQIVRPGGSIVIAAECSNGIPDYGQYRNLVLEGGSVEGIMEIISQPGFHRHDQWEAQLHAGILQKADVYVYSDGLTDAQIREMLLRPCHDISETLASLLADHGPGARLCVLPEGPQTIPYIISCQEEQNHAC